MSCPLVLDDLLSSAAEDGLCIALDALDQLQVRGPKAAVSAWRQTLQARRPEFLHALQRQRRHSKVHEMLASQPTVVRVVVVADGDAELVTISMAIRGVAVFDLTVARDQYRPFEILDLMAAHDAGSNTEITAATKLAVRGM